jgi:hypothetical protein
MSHDCPELGEGTELAASSRLNQHIAQHRGFDGASHDGPLAGIGGELVQQVVSGATANDMNDFNAPADHRLEASQDTLIL